MYYILLLFSFMCGGGNVRGIVAVRLLFTLLQVFYRLLHLMCIASSLMLDQSPFHKDYDIIKLKRPNTVCRVSMRLAF